MARSQREASHRAQNGPAVTLRIEEECMIVRSVVLFAVGSAVKSMLPTIESGAAPSRNNPAGLQAIWTWLNQTRERLPSSCMLASTGTAALRPRSCVRIGNSKSVPPKPAAPAILSANELMANRKARNTTIATLVPRRA